MNATKRATKQVTVEIVRNKFGNFETAPEFPPHASYFHPVIQKFQNALKPGLHCIGYFGATHDTGKIDKRGKRIYYSYFIPSKIMN